jgi:phenylpropionate dioxygenase-like ring-hydroxylating dioxygenase large terminal subunit
MPALGDDVVRAHAVGLEAREEGGIVWVRWGAAAPFARRALIDGGAVRLLSGEAETTLADMAENILDTTHTSIVHAGYLRGAHARRRVQPRVEVGDDWIEAHYPPAATPSGLVGGLIGGPRYEIVDRFRAPAIAEVEYRDGGVTQFAIQFHLSPAAAGSVSAVAVMSVPGRSLWSHAKLMALETMLKRVFAEDREMLGAVARNRAAFEASPALIAPQDLLRSGIESILRGEAPAAPARLPEIWV